MRTVDLLTVYVCQDSALYAKAHKILKLILSDLDRLQYMCNLLTYIHLSCPQTNQTALIKTKILLVTTWELIYYCLNRIICLFHPVSTYQNDITEQTEAPGQ